MNRIKKPRFFYGYIIVLAAFLFEVLSWGMWATFPIFLEPVLDEFGWTRAATSGAFSLYLVVTALLGIVMGRLNDRVGPRIIITVCGFFLGLGYLLTSQISTIWQLYLFYGVMLGIGQSGFVATLSTVSRWFTKRRALMTGIAASGACVSLAAFPAPATWLLSTYGWRNSYITIGIITMVLIVVTAQFLKRDPGQMGLTPYGEGVQTQRANGNGVSNDQVLEKVVHLLNKTVEKGCTEAEALAAYEMAQGLLFKYNLEMADVETFSPEQKDAKRIVGNGQASGISFYEAIRTRQLWMLSAIDFFLLVTYAAVAVHIVIYATGLGISLAAAANMLTITGLLGIPGGIILGIVADRIGSRRALIVVCVMVLVATSWLLAAKELWMIYLFAVIFGFAYGGLWALLSPVVADLFGLKAHGTTVGFANFSGMTGESVGPTMAGYIFDKTRSYQVAFLICVAASVIALILALFLKPIRTKGEKNDSARSI